MSAGGAAPRARLAAIGDADLDAACTYCHTHLNRRIPVADWKRAFTQPWIPEKPNNGFMLVDGDRVVGLFGAIYAEREIAGQRHRLMNHTSWSVLPAYRRQSLELLQALLAQTGYHVTSFTPNPEVVEICRYLGFFLLRPETAAWPNLPWSGLAGGPGRVVTDPDHAQGLLPAAAARDFANHRPFPWLAQLALGSDTGGWCHVLYKRKTWKKLPCADILHLSDPEIFLECRPALARHLLLGRGIASIQVPRRHLPRTPPDAWTGRDDQPRLAISPALDPAHLTALYTEMVALDLPL